MVHGVGIALFLSGQLLVVVVLPGKTLQDLLCLVGGTRRRRSSRVRGLELRQQRKLRMAAMQGGDHLSNRLANSDFASFVGDLPRLAPDVTNQCASGAEDSAGCT